jgi:peptide/nickel transport system substrate-binding protein
VRNDDYHGMNPDNPDITNLGVACVSGVQINFVADTDAQINSLLAGEADFVMTQPQIAFGERIATDDNFTVASEAGPVWEHWGMNTFNEHLSDPNVREALAFAMDKRAVMQALYTPLFGDLLPETGLGNVYWMSNQPPYVDHAGEAGYGVGDGDSAAALLEESGYELNGDGIWEHPDRGALSVRVGTTGGNQLRELQIQLLQEQLRELGWDISIDNVPGGAYFGERPFAEEAVACALSGGEEGDCTIWDITQFAWVGGPWPGSGHVAFLSDSGNNPYGYQNEEFDALTLECDTTFDDDERADCYNQLSEYVTTRNVDPDGLVVLPITQKPSFYAYSNQRLLRGAVAPDANNAGPLVNVVDYLPAP